MGSLSRKLISKARPREVNGADTAGCDQVVPTVGSLVSVFKVTICKVCDKDWGLTGTKNRW